VRKGGEGFEGKGLEPGRRRATGRMSHLLTFCCTRTSLNHLPSNHLCNQLISPHVINRLRHTLPQSTRELNFFGCRQLSGAHLNAVLAQTTALQQLNVNGCWGLGSLHLPGACGGLCLFVCLCVRGRVGCALLWVLLPSLLYSLPNQGLANQLGNARSVLQSKPQSTQTKQNPNQTRLPRAAHPGRLRLPQPHLPLIPKPPADRPARGRLRPPRRHHARAGAADAAAAAHQLRGPAGGVRGRAGGGRRRRRGWGAAGEGGGGGGAEPEWVWLDGRGGARAADRAGCCCGRVSGGTAGLSAGWLSSVRVCLCALVVRVRVWLIQLH